MTKSLAALQSLIALGESETLEFKRSTPELRRASETLCAFLNGDGAQVLVGVGAFDEFSAYVDHGHALPKSRTFKKLQGDPVPGSTHELCARSEGAPGRLFGHYDASGVFVFDRLAGHLP